MKYIKKLIAVFLVLVPVIFSGCYTKFATVNDQIVPQPKDESRQGQVDTIVTKEREICVWERDIFGYPELRCYNSYYSHNWYDFNNTPWWYRNSPYWYDYRRCPPYYYYDQLSGTCRYRGTSYNPPPSSGGSDTVTRGDLPDRPHSRTRSEVIPPADAKDSNVAGSSAPPVLPDAANKIISPGLSPEPAVPVPNEPSSLTKTPQTNSPAPVIIPTPGESVKVPADTSKRNSSRPHRNTRGM